ncbi:APC family permease [Nocardioides panacisoli]|uniref:APC family permease n=1 Tax=Nocardioides panacisoli TaxID=627624 RepID=UPI001C629625|nr:APC family permease [Nocardioides panacisoli]QYJ04819.1 APC family permease [Nocardioides panacisoli]
MGVGDVAKRIVVGRKLRSAQLGERLLSKRIALPVFANDPLSSVAYAPDEIFLILAFAGVSAYAFSWKIALVIAFVMFVVVLSYRQNVQAYRSGGGDYEVARTNLGSTAGLTVASALLTDYALTVAVSISAASQYAATTVDAFAGQQVWIAVGAVLLLTAVNLRGVRESQTAFAVPTYLFIVGLLAMVVWGFAREFLGGGLPDAPSADLQIVAQDSTADEVGGAAMVFLLLRAFASGSATLTGVQALGNGVPAFQQPKGRNAATTLSILGAIAVTLAVSVVVLANLTDVRVSEEPQDRLLNADGSPVGEDFHQDPVLGQLAETIFDNFMPGFVFIALITMLVLLLAANTAFNGFPVLASILAGDGYAPRALASRGDRLAYSNGVLLLAGAAIVLIVAFRAEVTSLIQLYIVGVFVAFTVSQAGMVRHWTRLLRTTKAAAARRTMQGSRAINAFGLTVTAVVLVVVLVTKFAQGAWISIAAMLVLFTLMRSIKIHYDRVAAELAIADEDKVMPTRVHAMVLVAKLHKPTLRALAFAKASRPNALEGIYVSVDPAETAQLLQEWETRNTGVPLKVLHSPYREIIKPIVEYASEIRRANPRGVVAVYIPEYVVGRWWEQLLHNQTALRLKGRLLFTPGVMVTSVPYQLRSSQRAREREERGDLRVQPGDLRGGRVPDEGPDA